MANTLDQARELLQQWAQDVSALNVLCQTPPGVVENKDQRHAFMRARGLATKFAEVAANEYIRLAEGLEATKEDHGGYTIRVKS